jgi:hypothetical protein
VTRDALGLNLDDRNVLELPPSIIIYGPLATGKSTELARAFNDALFVQSQPTVLRTFMSWIREKPDNPDAKPSEANPFPWTRDGLKRPAAVTIPEFMPDNKTRVDPRPYFDTIFERYNEKLREGTCPYSGIVIDEMAEFMMRAKHVIENDPKSKKGWAQMGLVKQWGYSIAQWPRATGQFAAMVMHETPPKYDMEEGSKTYGKMIYPGGPDFPYGKMIQEVGQMVDICLRRVLLPPEDLLAGGAARVAYVCKQTTEYVAKFRDIGIEFQANCDLVELLRRAHYPI